jgi:3-deoxy-7-phosphoheptulonate synthase
LIIVLRSGATPAEISKVCERVQSLGCVPNTTESEDRATILVTSIAGPEVRESLKRLRSMAAVENLVPLGAPYEKITRLGQLRGFDVDDVYVGGEALVLMAGPCTVESEEQIFAAAEAVARAGAHFLRGGAYKPSTSPYSFQGLGVAALEMLGAASRQFGLKVVTEVMDPRKVELVAQHAHMLQIGARNMQNYDLLREAGRSGMPILLKRGLSARIEEWLLAAEYLATSGATRIALCERGIRTFENATRNTLDLSSVPLVKSLCGLPVIVDPSHGTGRQDLVPPMALAAIAAGADGLLIEVHPNPEEALKDGMQSLSTEQFAECVPKIEKVAVAVGRQLARVSTMQRIN